MHSDRHQRASPAAPAGDAYRSAGQAAISNEGHAPGAIVDRPINSGAARIIPAHSSARRRREPVVQDQTLLYTYAKWAIGLKILGRSRP